jgi:hypothetical protein
MRLVFRVLTSLVAALLIPGCLDEQAEVQESLAGPSHLSATADGADIQLTWTDNSSSESSFRIDVSTVPITADSDVVEWTTVPADVTAYRYSSTPNSTRYFRVLAVTPLHQSVPSNVVSASTPNVPAAPGRLDALVGPDNSEINVTVIWDDVANETAYVLQRSPDGTSWASIATLGPNATYYVDMTTALNSRYAYRVRGTNRNGPGAWATAAWTQTRNTSWTRLTASTSGDTSWNTSISVYAGIAHIAAYDATYGDIVLGSTYYGSSTLSATTINPGFPESLGYGSTSIAADDMGVLHIAASDGFNGNLYHLTNLGGTWAADVIDNAAASDKAIIRSASDGTLYVAYQHFSGTAMGLRCAARSGSSWSSEWITASESVDYFDFAMDAAGILHVVYRRNMGGGLHSLGHAWKAPSSSWANETIPTQADPEMCSLALGPEGQIYAAYNSVASGALHFVSNMTGTWVNETVHRSPRWSWGRYNSIVSGASGGEVHIAYYDNIDGALRYAGRSSGGAWTLHLIDTPGDVGRFASIGRDPNVGLFIAYGDMSGRVMKAAMNYVSSPLNLMASPVTLNRIDLTWTDTPNETRYRVERSVDGGMTWADVATRPAGSTSYSDQGLASSQAYTYRVIAVNDFMESYPSNQVTALPAYITTVAFGPSADFGPYNDLAVGPSGMLHVAHSDQTNSNTLYTTGPVGGPFTTVTADSGPSAVSQVGFGSNAVGVSGGQAMVACSLFPSGVGTLSGLRFTTLTGTSPSTTTLEVSPPFGGYYGYYPKLRVAPDGTVHVVHLESVAGGYHWRHAYRTGGTWTLAGRITPQEVTSQYNNSLAIGSDGVPHLAYARSPSPGLTELVYGSRQSGAWSFSAPAGPVQPFYVTLALDSMNKPHVAYIQNGSAVLYGTNATGTWVFEPVRSGLFSIANINPAIGLDAATGRIHIVYSDAGLWHASKLAGGAWIRKPLDLSGTALTHVSLALDAQDFIHVAYYDASAKRLKILSAKP